MHISASHSEHLHQRRVFFCVFAGVFMSTMDSSMVNVALPILLETFRSTLAVIEWVVLVYLLTVTVLLVFWGKLCGRIGCGRLYARGMLIFAAGSLFCSLVPSVWLLIAARFIQALGASMMMATGPALIRSVFPPERLGRGLGLIGVATSLGLMSGPAISGLLLRWVHWRAIFWVTVPVAVLVYFWGRSALRQQVADSRAAEKDPGGAAKEGAFDLAGALLWTGSVIITFVLVTHVTSYCCGRGFGSLFFWSGVVLMVFGWLSFFRHERRCAAPILPLVLFRQRFFTMAIISSTLSFAALFFALILTPFYLNRILGLTADRVGYVMMSLPLCVFAVSPLAGRLHDRIGARIVASGGLLCCLSGTLLLAGLTAGSSPVSVAFRLALLGIGQAMFLSPNSASALAGVSDNQAGVTASLLATARNFGMLSGTALAGLSFSLHFGAASGGLDLKDFVPAAVPAFMHALNRSFLYAAVISGLAVTASLLRKKSGK